MIRNKIEITRTFLLLLVVLFLTACARYRYEIGSKDFGRGYVVSRNSFVIPEYTISKDGKAPQDKEIAMERFKRRKTIVEYYYKQMGYLFHEPMQYMHTIGQSFATPFKLPGIIVDEHRYQTDKEYKEKIDKQQEELDKKEEARIAKWQVLLDDFLKKDLEKEETVINATAKKE